MKEKKLLEIVQKNKKYIFLFATIITFIIIFLMSSRVIKGFKYSYYRVYNDGMVACFLFVPGFDEIDWLDRIEIAQKVDYPVRYTVHLLEYLIFGNLLGKTLDFFILHDEKKRKLKLFLLVFFITAILAGVDEVHQSFVFGQRCETYDVLVESCVTIIGALLSEMVIKIRCKKQI